MQGCSFLPLWLALYLALCLQRESERGREREKEARGRHNKARVHTAERLSRKTSCQPPAERKTTGHQPKQFGKRTSQGRFQLAQRVVTAVSHRGWEEEAGGSRGLREGERRESSCRPRRTENWRQKDQVSQQSVIRPVFENGWVRFCFWFKAKRSWLINWCHLYLWFVHFSKPQTVYC